MMLGPVGCGNGFFILSVFEIMVKFQFSVLSASAKSTLPPNSCDISTTPSLLHHIQLSSSYSSSSSFAFFSSSSKLLLLVLIFILLFSSLNSSFSFEKNPRIHFGPSSSFYLKLFKAQTLHTTHRRKKLLKVQFHEIFPPSKNGHIGYIDLGNNSGLSN